MFFKILSLRNASAVNAAIVMGHMHYYLHMHINSAHFTLLLLLRITSTKSSWWKKRGLDDYHHGTEQQDNEHFYPGFDCLDAGFVYFHEIIYHFSALRWSGRNAPACTVAWPVMLSHQCNFPFSSLPSAFLVSLTWKSLSQGDWSFSTCQPLVVSFLLLGDWCGSLLGVEHEPCHKVQESIQKASHWYKTIYFYLYRSGRSLPAQHSSIWYLVATFQVAPLLPISFFHNQRPWPRAQ